MQQPLLLKLIDRFYYPFSNSQSSLRPIDDLLFNVKSEHDGLVIPVIVALALISPFSKVTLSLFTYIFISIND